MWLHSSVATDQVNKLVLIFYLLQTTYYYLICVLFSELFPFSTELIEESSLLVWALIGDLEHIWQEGMHPLFLGNHSLLLRSTVSLLQLHLLAWTDCCWLRLRLGLCQVLHLILLSLQYLPSHTWLHTWLSHLLVLSLLAHHLSLSPRLGHLLL